MKFIADRLVAFFLLVMVFAIAIIIKKCDGPRVKREKEKHEKQVEINKDKFYYPKYRDKANHWNVYPANLIGAEGWIRENEECKDQYEDYKIVVVNQFGVSYRRDEARRFKGRLIVRKKGDNKNFEIRFRCFKPDYSMGNWLINNN